jgi:hypothetical protein
MAKVLRCNEGTHLCVSCFQAGDGTQAHHAGKPNRGHRKLNLTRYSRRLQLSSGYSQPVPARGAAMDASGPTPGTCYKPSGSC